MKDIYNYIEQNKNKTINQLPWNTLDNLICTTISYLIFETKKEPQTIQNYYKYITTNKEKIIYNFPIKKAYELLEQINNTPRYNKIIIKNIIRKLDNTTEFAAITYEIEDITIISFKGSDNSLISWIENLKLSYIYPTNTQKEAINYLNQTKANKIYINGHSKGGHLAIISAINASKEIQNKIIEIDNFDGPGLRKEEYQTTKYQQILPKIKNILPKDSYIGSLMYNQNYTYIETNTFGIRVHYPYYWIFEKTNETKISQKLHKLTTEDLTKLDKQQTTNTLNEIISNIPTNNNFDIKEIYETIINLNNIDPQTKQHLLKIINIIKEELIKR